MKTILLTIFFLLVSCSTSEKGNFRILETETKVEHRATQVTIYDEENKIKFVEDGKTQVFQGSYELYEE